MGARTLGNSAELARALVPTQTSTGKPRAASGVLVK
jgi:hypothetical protein